MNEFHIRTLTESDWAIYKTIRLLSLIDSPDSFGSTYAREILFPDSEWQSRLAPLARAGYALPLIAEVDDQPVGLAWCLIHEPALQTACVYQMWVAPEVRGKGIAKALLNQIRTWALTKKCDYVTLAVTTSNDAAVELYLSEGFVPSGQIESLRDGSSIMAQPMKLALSTSSKSKA